MEQNNRRGNTRNLFRKIGNIKGIFCPKMDTIKDRNGRDLDTLKRSRRDGAVLRNAELISYRLNQDRWEKHQQPQKCRYYYSNGREQRGTKEPLDEC